MKKLYFLNEEESKRILKLHKDSTKRQYLSEATIKDNKIVFENENPVTIKLYELLKYNTTGVNIDETKLVDAILEIPDLQTLTLVNTEITDIANLLKKPDMAGLAKIFNDVLDFQFGDREDINRLIVHLNKLGVPEETTRHLISNDFVMPNLPSKEVPKSDYIPGEDEKWKNYPCVVSHPKAKKEKSMVGGFTYLIDGVDYYSNGRKNVGGKMVNYTCNDPEFKPKSESKVKQLTTPTDAELDAVLGKL